ncbi:MAG TPA: hypothetical protein PK014_00300 [Thermoanaerobaculia bacterium]|nr:hypothetical protein [Thermoanaerobaculia bacterium]HXK66912.1 hypothetical protein [Thermoanaerobaculia bacterium]
MDPTAELVKKALEQHPGEVGVVDISEYIIDSAREKSDRPAYIKVAVPDHVVKNLRGDPSRRDKLCLVFIPHSLKERSESRIILPGELIR